MADEYQTKPTLETILERINALGVEVREGFARVEGRFEDLDVRVARVESGVNATRSEMGSGSTKGDMLRLAHGHNYRAVPALPQSETGAERLGS